MGWLANPIHLCEYSVTTNLYFLIPSHFSPSPPSPPPLWQPLNCICKSVLVLFVHFVFQITHQREITWLSLSDLFQGLSLFDSVRCAPSGLCQPGGALLAPPEPRC